MNALEQLKQYTTIVCDTGDIDSITQYKPTDATTNPSLILAAAQNPRYASLIEDAITWAHQQKIDSSELLSSIMDKLFVNFGVAILNIVSGRVSTELDARLSFDTQACIQKAEKIIDLYAQAGFSKERILIKIAATWEGIQAAHYLQRKGICCNLTLLFALPQAIACAQAQVTLISPFVGRILDWHMQQHPQATFAPQEDPGVCSVQEIYRYYKQHGYKTQVMGASFRNIHQILQLAGCDLLTISPKLLQQLQETTVQVPRILDPKLSSPIKKMELEEKEFRWMMNENAMAEQKLAEGIRVFAADQAKLEALLIQRGCMQKK